MSRARGAFVGGAVWAGAVLVVGPNPFDTVWAKTLLMLAPLVLVPLGLDLVPVEERPPWWRRWWRVATMALLPAALLLGSAFLLPQGTASAALAVPWLAVTVLIAVLGLFRVLSHLGGPLHEVCMDAGLMYLVVGSGWALLDRWGMRPLAFEAVIVLLTAIHFHYAGFVLPILAGLAARRVRGVTARAAGAGVITGVPLVAAGITATQLGAGPSLECVAAWWLALAGLLTGWLHIRLATQGRSGPAVRLLWVVSAGSLIAGMALAALYGSRFYLPIPWLDIPWMRVLHGTANGVGFGLAGLVGWRLELTRRAHR